MLQSFSQDDRDHMVENGMITVTCEFCNSTYVFEPARSRRTTADAAAQLIVACAVLRHVEREGRDLDVERLAGVRHHAVACRS